MEENNRNTLNKVVYLISHSGLKWLLLDFYTKFLNPGIKCLLAIFNKLFNSAFRKLDGGSICLKLFKFRFKVIGIHQMIFLCSVAFFDCN